MTSNKKKFVIPELSVHGSVEEITEQGGSINNFDVPLGNIDGGTPVGQVTS
jgi:hypothetical protein